MAHVKVSIGTTAYATKVVASRHELVADEPVAQGGQDAGPAPYELLLASLGACTAITLRMYADRKQWNLAAVQVDLHYGKEGDTARIDRLLKIEGDLTAEQRARLADIAERTPVTLTLKSGLAIQTRLA